MKLQKFIDILGKSDDTDLDFFKKYGNNVLQSETLLIKLLELKWSRQKRLKLVGLSWIIRCDMISKNFGDKEEVCFDGILPVYRYFETYMSFGCSFFGKMRVPFEEWEDLAKEQVDILKILVEKNQLKFWKRTKLVRDLCKKGEKRTKLFIKKGYIDPIYIMDPMGQ